MKYVYAVFGSHNNVGAINELNNFLQSKGIETDLVYYKGDSGVTAYILTDQIKEAYYQGSNYAINHLADQSGESVIGWMQGDRLVSKNLTNLAYEALKYKEANKFEEFKWPIIRQIVQYDEDKNLEVAALQQGKLKYIRSHGDKFPKVKDQIKVEVDSKYFEGLLRGFLEEKLGFVPDFVQSFSEGKTINLSSENEIGITDLTGYVAIIQNLRFFLEASTAIINYSEDWSKFIESKNKSMYLALQEGELTHNLSNIIKNITNYNKEKKEREDIIEKAKNTIKEEEKSIDVLNELIKKDSIDAKIAQEKLNKFRCEHPTHTQKYKFTGNPASENDGMGTK